MSFQTLSADFSVAGQITPQDVSAIANAGFKSIICNRPDGEAGADQPTFREIEMAALNEGLQVRYLPVVSGQITSDQGAAMAGLLAQLTTPVLAYCRSGARSRALWQLAQTQGQAG
jgi:sulfide:quinone oxidoreductase